MQRNELQNLIARTLIGGYESDAYREYRNLDFRGVFSRENYQEMFSITQAELKKSDLKNAALVWDIYLCAREEIKPYDSSNMISIRTGMLYKSGCAYNLRALYLKNRAKCDADYASAYEVFLQAKALGHIPAIYNLGVFHSHGLGREIDQAQARYYFELAAQHQFPAAYYALGIFAKHGAGGYTSDNNQALAFFKIGAKLGDKAAINAIYNLANELYPDAEFGVDTEKAISLLTIAAKYEHPCALTTLGYIYHTQKQYLTAKNLYKRASKFNEKQSLYNLATIYARGEIVAQNKEKAMLFAKRAVKAGHCFACNMVVELYLERAVATEHCKIIKYLEKGVDAKQIDCINLLAFYYYHGKKGLQKNVSKATELWLEGGKLQNVESYYNLIWLYIRGETNLITEEQAWEYLNTGVLAKHALSCFLRARLYKDENKLDLAAKLYRIGLLNRRNMTYEHIRQEFSIAETGSMIERYHWYMTDATETLPPEILKLYHRHPWTIIQAILEDDVIDRKTRLDYLLQLPGTFLKHIKSLSLSHPIRLSVEKLYEELECELFYDYRYGRIQQIEFLANLSELATVFRDKRLSAYLTITILFDAILNNCINSIEMPYALARIFRCHKTIIRLDHRTANENILNDATHQSYMSLDAYLHLFTAHLQLIEAYVGILQAEMLKISHLFSIKQSHALVNPHGLLMLTDNLVAPNQPQVCQEAFSKFCDHVKAINTPLLWLSIKEKVKNIPPQQQLTKVWQFFHSGKNKYAVTNPTSSPGLTWGLALNAT